MDAMEIHASPFKMDKYVICHLTRVVAHLWSRSQEIRQAICNEYLNSFELFIFYDLSEIQHASLLSQCFSAGREISL